MADTLKQDFIDLVRLTPDGIGDFLTTPLPTPPTIGTPSSVDAAIIANGIAAKFVCDLFQPFAGLTPVELLLRIGQHNSVLESAMLAGLEYITETEEQNDLEILAPESGSTLKPGDVLLSAQAKNGTMVQCAVEIEGHAPISLDDNEGVFEGTITLEEPGEYTATFTGLFEKEKTATATTTFTIDEEGDEPGGDNKNALKKAADKISDGLGLLLKGMTKAGKVYLLGVLTIIKTAFTAWGSILKKLAGTAKQAEIEGFLTAAGDALTALETAINAGNSEAATAAIAAVKTAMSKAGSLL